MQIRVRVPAMPATQSSARARRFFVASNTAGILAQAYAQSDATHSTLLGQSATDISSGSNACAGQTGSPRTCTFSIDAPEGADTLVIRSYDSAPAGGGFTGSHQLAAATVNATLSTASPNAVSVTLGGIISALQVLAPNPTLRGTVASSQNIIVEGFDADGNVILSDAYVDANGNPVSVALSVTPNAGNVFSLATPSLSAPSATGVALSYNGAATSPVTSTIQASTGSISAQATLTLGGPAFTEYPTTTAAAGVGGLAVAGYGGISTSVFFTEPQANKIASVTTTGTMTEYNPGGTTPTAIVAGPTGSGYLGNNLFYSDAGSSNIGAVSNAGVSQGFQSTPTAGAAPVGITLGPDGNIWYTESAVSKIGVFNLHSLVSTDFTTISPSANPQYITTGSDGRLWFTEQNANIIGSMSTTGGLIEYAVPTGASQPTGIAAGPDGSLWFTEKHGNKVAMITTAGIVTEFAIPTAGASPTQIAAGPDGNMWFLESTSGKLARISVATHTVSEFSAPSPGLLSGIVSGPDGNIWFGESAASKVAKFVW